MSFEDFRQKLLSLVSSLEEPFRILDALRTPKRRAALRTAIWDMIGGDPRHVPRESIVSSKTSDPKKKISPRTQEEWDW